MSAGTPSRAAAKITEKDLLEWGTRIGAAAHYDNVDRAQLENLIISLDAVEGNESLLVTAAFALRQSQRDRGKPLISPRTAKLVAQALIHLYENNAGKKEARKMLDFAKWVYEALGRGRGEGRPRFRGAPEKLTLEDLLKQLAGGG